MPNWTDTYIKIHGTKDNCLNVLNRFITNETENDTRYSVYRDNFYGCQNLIRRNEISIPIRRKYFYRSFTFTSSKELYDKVYNYYDDDKQEIEIYVACAWSADTCLVNKGITYFSKYIINNACVSIMEMCVLYNVSVEIMSDEYGGSFYEYIVVDNKGTIICNQYNDMQFNIVCPECNDFVYTEIPFAKQIGLSQSELDNLKCECCGHVGLVKRLFT